MKERIRRFIFTSIDNSLDACRVAFSNKTLAPGDVIAHRMILDSVFLRMCGLFEQKVLNILWYIGFNNPEERYDLMNIARGQVINVDNFNKVTAFLDKALSSLSSDNTWRVELWTHVDLWRRAHWRIFSKLANSAVVRSSAREFEVFKRCAPLRYFCFELRVAKKYNKDDWKNKRIMELSKIHKKLRTEYDALYEYTGLAKKDKFSNKDFINNITKKYMPFYYEKLMHKRHELAHSFHLFSNGKPALEDLGDKLFAYENCYFRFMMLLYLDLVLQRYFSDLQHIQERRII